MPGPEAALLNGPQNSQVAGPKAVHTCCHHAERMGTLQWHVAALQEDHLFLPCRVGLLLPRAWQRTAYATIAAWGQPSRALCVVSDTVKDSNWLRAGLRRNC